MVVVVAREGRRSRNGLVREGKKVSTQVEVVDTSETPQCYRPSASLG